MSEKEAFLVLADGTVFSGRAFGATAAARRTGEGEVVFHTGMSGYQEILTDPSYAGQIVVMTYPEIGNTGVNPEDEESSKVHLGGFVVRDYVDYPSSWRSEESLDAYLKRQDVPGISDVDTRALVRRLRSGGAQNGVVVHGRAALEAARVRTAELQSMEGRDLVVEVSCKQPYHWTEGNSWTAPKTRPTPTYRVVAYDFGIKRNILRRLVDSGFEVTVVPATTPAADVLKLAPDGVFLSNGPGDPAALPYASEAVAGLLGKVPIFGICLGHQILGLALGGKTEKLRFGHHGANQPAHCADDGRVMIASENHGFAVTPQSLEAFPDVVVTHRNLNDGCIEGLRNDRLSAFSVQYHPEAAPGPHDTAYLFAQFRKLIEEKRA